MAKKSYTRSLGEGVRKRHYHTTEKGKVVYFVVQLEVEVMGEWKIELYLDYAEALTVADEDININWESYKERFLRGENP